MEDALKMLLAQLIGERPVLEVARAAGVNYPGVYAILEGRSRRPNADMLFKLATALTPDGDAMETYKRLALAAYGVIAPPPDMPNGPEGSDDNGTLETAPPDANLREEQNWPRAGRKPQKLSTAT